MQQNIEHPENEACYEGLAVNKGIEQPDPVNPAIAESRLGIQGILMKRVPFLVAFIFFFVTLV